jgi:hypothetical protein
MTMLGGGARLLSEEAYFYAGYAYTRLDNKLMEPIHRHVWIDEVGFKPLSRSAAFWLRPMTVSIGAIQGLGPFTAADFGAVGPYTANDSVKVFVRIGYDIWWHGCWKYRCQND